MIDINLLRVDKGGNPDLVRESQRKRGGRVELVDEVIALDDEWKKARFQADQKNKEINAINKEISALYKQGKKDDAATLIAKKTDTEAQQIQLTKLSDEKEVILNKKLTLIGNIVHDSCVDSLTEDDNAVIKKWWPDGRTEDAERQRHKELVKEDKGVPGLLPHHEVLAGIEGYDAARGANIAGHRGYFLTGPGVDFNLALMQYGLDFLEERGYTKLWTPFFMKRETMAKTAQLEQFDEELYKVVEREPGTSESKEDKEAEEPKYLIATSEQPISGFHAGEWFSESDDLPRKYAGVSTCFRKEAGSAGRDNWGIFRVHQFEKIEQFVLTDPEKSWEMHEEMLEAAELFYQSLGIPYHVISIVSGALNNAAAKKYDLEAWFPFQTTYKELVSCSNCTDYQSRRLEIRYGAKKLNDTVKKYVHCLNCTLTATERTICCILENYQTETGVVVPEVLRPYMRGKSFFPYKKIPGASAGKEAGGHLKKARAEEAMRDTFWYSITH
ncbi:serine---tRNA ligase [Synchytrium microbalum]|uniref:serine--tRNA ligase n=1 Tax=Synchytrium microbalum TaxID=1806994 RepID=A0A507CJI6_9FUNG|nr:serine---tRNA ligase [Synchytrium microbalum]TPX37975.1 serine---tRNA ligase [Synchytrium microbalum]